MEITCRKVIQFTKEERLQSSSQRCVLQACRSWASNFIIQKHPQTESNFISTESNFISMITSKLVWDLEKKSWKLKWKVSKQVKVVLEKSQLTELKTAAVMLEKCPSKSRLFWKNLH